MKKQLTFFAIALFMASLSFAQETSEDENASSSGKDYNQFSIEGNVGINRPDDNFSPNYFSSNADDQFAFNSISHFNLGVRYMFNEKFGLKLDGAYDTFEPEGDSSLPFKTNQIRFGLQGVTNLRSVLGFDSFSSRLGLLAHGGIQVFFLSPDSRNGVDLSSNPTDSNGGFIFGLTPQYRISDRVVATADASFIYNYRSHLTWDGVQIDPSKNLESSFMNLSLGLTVYLGSNDIHADWVSAPEKGYASQDELDALKAKMDDLESRLADDDSDGVPNYLDKDSNTPAGVIVDTNGLTTDKNGNGIPDSMEEPLDELYGQTFAGGSGPGSMDLIKELANKGVLGAYFDFDISVPQEASYNSIRAISMYMKENNSAKVAITGYADIMGGDSYNNALSLRRAEKVKEILVASGIDASRITTTGAGENSSIEQSTDSARQLARTATFMIN